MFLRPSSCFTEELPIFSLLQKWHEQGKKGKKPVSHPLPPERCQELIMSSTSYAMAIVWIQEFIELPRWIETISPACSLSPKSRIALTAGDYSHWTPPPACSELKGHNSEIEEAQSHWKGFCISMWLNCITHSGRKGLDPFRLSLGAEPSCFLFCSPSICRLNHWEDFPRLAEHLLVVPHILWQRVPQFMWLWVKKPYPLQEINLPVKDSGVFLVWKPFHSIDPACCPFSLSFKYFFCGYVLNLFHFTSVTPTFHSKLFKSCLQSSLFIIWYLLQARSCHPHSQQSFISLVKGWDINKTLSPPYCWNFWEVFHHKTPWRCRNSPEIKKS